MKLRTPRDAQPDRPAQGRSAMPTDRIDGPLKTTGTAPYAYERHDVVANQAYGYVVGSAIAKGRIAGDRSEKRQGRARRARHRDRGERRQARRRLRATRPSCSAARRSNIIIRRSRSSSRRRSKRRAPPRSSFASTTCRPTARSTSRAAKDSAKKSEPSFGGPADTAAGDFAGAFAAAPVKLDETYTHA